ncbi:hypothetical protein [Methanosphaerula palustris]|uniref:Uncharacterized protein n=1 Tax=Methanosphaerula palustris (strain ATCC BAA-1556 / DSM 19958 / E1-9c) TaxID=521011 RepID=B8GJ98_METPE|nr:hypothetical protein [Methanosphaerula palustris]ACL16939.1 hypothetical protein Mpal_1627 [Methanosphaerula palustris E1-9c]
MMAGISIVPDLGYLGEGISEGLARGLLVCFGGENLTGEGMGIGSVAIRCPGFTCFSRTSKDSPGGEGIVIRTFLVDTRMSWSILGFVSPSLTRSIESGIGAYMRHPGLQRLLMVPVMPLRSLFGIHPVFESIPPTAEVTFTYQITGTAVDISARVRRLAGPVGTVCLLNELSADCFVTGWIGGIVPPPPGWEELSRERGAKSLYDPVHQIRFSIAAISTSPPLQSKIFWGREMGEDLGWAGFAVEVESPDGMVVPNEVRYRIEFTVGGLT